MANLDHNYIGYLLENTNIELDGERLNGVDYANIKTKATTTSINEIPVAYPLINKPTIKNITNNTIYFNKYSTIDTFNGPHTSTEINISTTNNFNNVIIAETINSNILLYNISNLNSDTPYYVRIQFVSKYHISEWSDTFEFTIPPKGMIDKPIIQIGGYPNNIPENPYITLSKFNVNNDTDQHISTDWVIENTTGEVESISLKDEFNKTKLKLDNINLELGVDYIIKATYNGDKFTSETGTLEFTPTYGAGILPANIQIDGYPNNIFTSPLIFISSFQATSNEYVHELTTLQIFKNNIAVYVVNLDTDTYIHQIPTGILSINNEYTLKVFYTDTNDFNSPITTIQFKPTLMSFIETPGIIINKNNGLAPINPSVILNNFSSLIDGQLHLKTEYLLYNNNNDIIYSALEEQDLLEHNIVDNDIESNLKYTLLVRFITNDYYSNWGVGEFTTDNNDVISAPALRIDGQDTLTLPAPYMLIDQDFRSVNDVEVHVATEWRIETMTGIILWNEISTINKYVNLVDVNVLKGGIEYVFKARFIGINYKSGWTTLIEAISIYPYNAVIYDRGEIIPNDYKHTNNVFYNPYIITDVCPIDDRHALMVGYEPYDHDTYRTAYNNRFSMIHNFIDGAYYDIRHQEHGTREYGNKLVRVGKYVYSIGGISVTSGVNPINTLSTSYTISPTGVVSDGIVRRFNTETFEWEEPILDVFSVYDHCMTTIDDNTVLTFGGINYKGRSPSYFTTLDFLDGNEILYTNISNPDQSVISFLYLKTSMVKMNSNEILVTGGYHRLATSLMYIEDAMHLYNVNTKLYSLLDARLPKRLYGHTMIKLDNGYFLLLGGHVEIDTSNEIGTFNRDCYILDVNKWVWSLFHTFPYETTEVKATKIDTGHVLVTTRYNDSYYEYGTMTTHY